MTLLAAWAAAGSAHQDHRANPGRRLPVQDRGDPAEHDRGADGQAPGQPRGTSWPTTRPTCRWTTREHRAVWASMPPIEVVADGGSNRARDARLGPGTAGGQLVHARHHNRNEPVQYVWRSDRKQLHLFASSDGRSFLIQLRRLASYLQAGLLLPAEEETLTVRATRERAGQAGRQSRTPAELTPRAYRPPTGRQAAARLAGRDGAWRLSGRAVFRRRRTARRAPAHRAPRRSSSTPSAR